MFFVRVKWCVWVSDLRARVRYLFEPAEIDCYTGLVSTRGVAEVRPESFDRPAKGMARTTRTRVNVGIGLRYLVRGDGRH